MTGFKTHNVMPVWGLGLTICITGANDVLKFNKLVLTKYSLLVNYLFYPGYLSQVDVFCVKQTNKYLDNTWALQKQIIKTHHDW